MAESDPNLPFHKAIVQTLHMMVADEGPLDKAENGDSLRPILYLLSISIIPEDHDKIQEELDELISALAEMEDPKIDGDLITLYRKVVIKLHEQKKRANNTQQTIPIIQLNDESLSVRARRALQRMNITLLSELAKKTEQEILSVKNTGQTQINESNRLFTKHNLPPLKKTAEI